MDPVFIKGLAAFIVMVIVFIGSVWLLLSMILGVRLGYFVMASCLFGIMIILSLIWFTTALGPRGPETTWNAIAVGSDLTTVESEFGSFDVSDYPGGDWQAPAKGKYLADIKGDNDTLKEVDNAKPVADAFLGKAVSPIPGIRKEAEEHVLSDVNLEPGKFETTDFRMKQVEVNGKDSIIAVATAVSSDVLITPPLSNGAAEGEITGFLVDPGERVETGTPLVSVKTEDGDVQVAADKPGKLISFGLRKGDKIKPGGPFAKIDVTGQPGAAKPVEVVSVRVRGGVRIPSLYYLVISTLLFAVHMAGLRSTERNRAPEALPA